LSFLLENPFVDRVESAELLLDRLDLQPAMRVLDVGCGPGRVSLPAARCVGQAGEVVALDIQDEMLRRAQSRAQPRAIGNIRFVRAGAGQGALAPGRFDRALLVTVLGDGSAARRDVPADPADPASGQAGTVRD